MQQGNNDKEIIELLRDIYQNQINNEKIKIDLLISIDDKLSELLKNK